MGPYPINAARYLFQDEPIDVFAEKIETGPTDVLFAVTMRFPRNRVAQFSVGFGASSIDQYRVIGKTGEIEMLHGFGFGERKDQIVTIDGKKEHTHISETDQFGGELKYFSNCIIDDRRPEPDGREGLADVRVIKAIERSVETGQVQKLAPFEKPERPGLRQAAKLAPVKAPKMVNASQP
jgi:predicted dehydrogenase